MANEIPRIGVNTNAVGNSYEGSPKGSDVLSEAEVTADVQPLATNFIPAGDVLSIMAQQANIHRPQVYDVSKYVNADQAARIAAMMGDFEGAVAKGLEAIELEGLHLSDSAALALAASMVE